ncbi:putative leucine-rich repeat receptor-like serine/threonine-protein kinase [Vitis vinifera]|uniref:non-specific serine/threonine protein kinase n=1 Tax=Vitis vinifera TaxID=29760 RepID=A0A438K6S2_VITVI|nr:putative leucine-rich repeat receptor-like serine/threonine-protein kinase [Vitis vinifera]
MHDEFLTQLEADHESWQAKAYVTNVDLADHSLVIISLHSSGWVLGTFHENQSGQWKLSAEEGFISINCGIAPGSDYTDDETQIYYTLDAKFIDTGINYNVSKEYVDEDTDQLMDVRSFPEGDRNCYALPPGQGKNHKYLIRAWFMYGNYDSKNQPLVFKLYLGVDEWATVNITNASVIIRKEIIHIPTTDVIDVCLVNAGSGTPFISVLELQQLNDSIYSPTEPGSLLLHDRWDFGIVMATAATPANESEPLRISLDIDDDPSQKLYIYMHFAEVKEGVFREFTTFVNDDEAWGGLTNRSTLPPIINAMEVYIIKEFSQGSTQQNDVDAIKGIKSEYAVSRNWQGDPCLPIKYQWDGLTCSLDISPAIITLNLSSSNLAGNILTSFSGLKSLQNLDLSYNNLTGPVPEFFADLPSLTTLNLTGNNLTGSVPQAVMDKLKDGTLSLGENPSLCQSASCQGKEKKKSRFLVPVLIAIPNVIVILILITALAMIIRKFRRRETKEKSGNSEFTYSEVVSITNNFSQTIGRGGFGQVFLGTLADGTQVAVKVHSESSIQEAKALQAEVKLLTRVHHKNLVRLIGYCDDGTNMVLIYEYMSNGNLQQKERSRRCLNWEERLQIAVDAAHGLEYLHNGCKPPIVHRDMKSSNILLTETLEAKIADFGMSRDLESGALLSTDPVGTPGYLDPEYQSAGLNKKSDVYSFGIVLLELLTGRPAIIPGAFIYRDSLSMCSINRNAKARHESCSGRLEGMLETGVASRRIKMVGSHLEDVPVVLSTESAPHASIDLAARYFLAQLGMGFRDLPWKPIWSAGAHGQGKKTSMDSRPPLVWLIFVLVTIMSSGNNPELVAGKPHHAASTFPHDHPSPRRLAADTQGFISIDCGIAPGSSYTDDRTQIHYTSDAEFTDTGINYNVSRSENPSKQLMNVRSFPEGARNCYTLEPEKGKGNKYLIRAFFMYGNYDSKNQVPVFKLYLGVDKWDTIKFKNSNKIVRKEIIHIPKTDYIDVCLVNNGSGTPFISALELRPLDNSSYNKTELGSLLLSNRWTSVQSKKNFKSGFESYSYSDNPFKLPGIVMSTAATPKNESEPLSFFLDMDYPSQRFYLFMHFSEVLQLQGNQSRVFTIWLNGTLWNDPVTDESALPPIINALEVYVIKEFSQSTTDRDDGKIHPSFSNLKSLQTLDLSHNNLTGSVPEFLTELPSLTFLNNLKGSVPRAYGEVSEWHIVLESWRKSKSLCVSLMQRKAEQELRCSSSRIRYISSGPVPSNCCWYHLELQKERRQREGSLKSGNSEFTYSELVTITHNFSSTIGQGGFGNVHLGTLVDGTQVTVKLRSQSSMQGPREFQAEAKLLKRVHHKNLVRLTGYCNDGTNTALIYEYMSNGNLRHSERYGCFVLEREASNAVDVAQGLEYLHNGCKPPIIHRDVKTSNILLNKKLQAKIADFGLSRDLAIESGSHASTIPAGTPGYLDPDSMISPMLKRGDIQNIVDPRLQGDFNTNSAWKALETALACVPSTAIQRPDMSHVLADLKDCWRWWVP